MGREALQETKIGAGADASSDIDGIKTKTDAGFSGNSIIASIQRGTMSFPNADGAESETISSVDTAKSILIIRGVDGSSSQWQNDTARLHIASSTTVNGNRGSTSGALNVYFTVIEFN